MEVAPGGYVALPFGLYELAALLSGVMDRAVVSAVGCMPLLGGRWISPPDSPTIPHKDFTQQFKLLALVVFYIIAEIHRGPRVIIRLVCRSMIGQATITARTALTLAEEKLQDSYPKNPHNLIRSLTMTSGGVRP